MDDDVGQATLKACRPAPAAAAVQSRCDGSLKSPPRKTAFPPATYGCISLRSSFICTPRADLAALIACASLRIKPSRMSYGWYGYAGRCAPKTYASLPTAVCTRTPLRSVCVIGNRLRMATSVLPLSAPRSKEKSRYTHPSDCASAAARPSDSWMTATSAPEARITSTVLASELPWRMLKLDTLMVSAVCAAARRGDGARVAITTNAVTTNALGPRCTM